MARPSRIVGQLTLAIVGVVGSLYAGETANSVSPIEMDKLVQQLGDESFVRRERATQALSESGVAARRSLLAGIQGTQPEIRWRCARLWKAVQDLDFQERANAFLNELDANNSHEFPGWARYRAVLGSSRDARELFLAMQQADPVLWAELDGEAAPSQALFSYRAAQLQMLLRDPAQRNGIASGSAATILFLAVENRQNTPPGATATVNAMLELSLVQDMLKQYPSFRELWVMWRATIIDDRPVYERLMTALRNNLKDEAQDAARTLLTAQDVPAIQKQYALLALANSKSPVDLGLIQKHLADPSPIDTYFTRGVVIKSQLRDVALAALILGVGKDPKEFGFAYLRQDANTIYSPSTLGFRDSAERDAALEKWLAYASRQVFEESP